MAEKPIIFNDEMVRAILAGRKTQTRRPVKWPVMSRSDGSKRRIFIEGNAAEMNQLLRERQRHPLRQIKSPYSPGDLLYVRETWAQPENVIYYRADEAALLPPGAKWRPSIHMPKWAARIWLRVVAVRVERVRDISRDGVLAEGFPWGASLAREAYHFSDAWEAAYPGSWERNDWVWVYEFERAEAPRGGGGWKMTDVATTHAEGCWAWGPKHHACAVREIERLRARVAEMERDARLGAVVREAAEQTEDISDVEVLRDGDLCRGGYIGTLVVTEHQFDVLRAIADALRAEEGRLR